MENNKQKTAVEYLVEGINKLTGLSIANDEPMVEQAKEMEKQQQGYSEEEVEDIMAETWIQCIGNDGNNFKEVRNKILKRFKNK